MTDQALKVTAGVDTHHDTHHAAVIDHLGRHLADKEFDATGTGYQQLLTWLDSFGPLAAIGVEGTGSYGAELARTLTRTGLRVVEVDRPDRKTRRSKGKSDPIDAYAAAQAVASGRASGTPKTRDGAVESIRALRVARRSAVKARTQALNQLHQLLVTAPEQLRSTLRGLSPKALVQACARLRPGPDLADPTQATKAALRRLAKRIGALDEEITELDTHLKPLTTQTAPGLLNLKGVGPEVAGQLLATAGDNPDRLRSEAAFAHLCGAAPIPASSGRRDRHRLNRGGDRAANHALHTIVLTRMSCDGRTRAYVERRTRDGLSTKEIMRCLKRYVAREVYPVLMRSIRTTSTVCGTPRKDLTQAV
ncbi:IS110 family transposase [Nocardiopsis sp. EMB25]|uniref:IS110 family transposase n=1 Tax=Nocardiopsis sp. EMB25 TaxID=2835867 RepID=UPI002283DA02|nr:IS110 family transposase [Nocardiopsis sp. EMB25]MCY9782352.1 IS110 family transposase [Nocardiopsis sp. EMB25]MCY9782865.1 IS110 family transposase [Nocardiopsis sp. EMB25]MCY9783156.1 IS110 family transposase [Nocardiopsis sp. EMB25]MCY9786918.1 IS110 family transposase [Nocardiopsis sp. EMB25]